MGDKKALNLRIWVSTSIYLFLWNCQAWYYLRTVPGSTSGRPFTSRHGRSSAARAPFGAIAKSRQPKELSTVGSTHSLCALMGAPYGTARVPLTTRMMPRIPSPASSSPLPFILHRPRPRWNPAIPKARKPVDSRIRVRKRSGAFALIIGVVVEGGGNLRFGEKSTTTSY